MRFADGLGALEQQSGFREGIRHPPAFRHVSRHSRLKRIKPAGGVILFCREEFILCSDISRFLRKDIISQHGGAVRLLNLCFFFLFPLLKVFKRLLHGSRLKRPLFDAVETSFNLLSAFLFEASPFATELQPAGFENLQGLGRHAGRESEERIGFKKPVLRPELAREFPGFSDFLREGIS